MADIGDPAGAAEQRPKPSKLPLVGAIVLAALGLGVIGMMLVGSPDSEGTDVATDAVAADVEVHGEPLPTFADDSGGDPAVGMTAPALAGSGVDGESLEVDPADGTPRVLLFVAHWCDVCADEIPALQQARDDGDLRDDVELVAVSTGVRPERANFPPGEWLADAGWTAPTLVDNEERHAAGAYGLAGYPYWVFTQGDGTVVGRLGGALDIDDLALLMDELADRG